MEKGEQMQGETEQCPGRGEERGMETSRETSLGGGGEKKSSTLLQRNISIIAL